MRHLYLVGAILASPAYADPAEITEIQARLGSDGWRFDVAVLHGDTGGDDYADGWRIEGPDGAVLGERPLAHPHVNEQPFTRSTSGVAIPEGMTEVFIRTRTNTEGWAEDVVAFTLPGGE